MGFGVNLGGLWRPKMGSKALASGSFSLPAALTLDAARGHRFVITARKKNKANEPDFDLWLFAADEQSEGPSLDAPSLDAPAEMVDDLPFDAAGAAQ